MANIKNKQKLRSNFKQQHKAHLASPTWFYNTPQTFSTQSPPSLFTAHLPFSPVFFFLPLRNLKLGVFIINSNLTLDYLLKREYGKEKINKILTVFILLKYV